LQSPLETRELTSVGSFANHYGLRRFRVMKKHNRLSFDMEPSRCGKREVAHVLRERGFLVRGVWNSGKTVSQLRRAS